MNEKKGKHNKDSQIFFDNIWVFFKNRNKKKSFDDPKIFFRFTHVEQKYLDCQYRKKNKTNKKKRTDRHTDRQEIIIIKEYE
jgi:hypothetical protein